VKISIWFGSTTCVHALSSQVNLSPPEESLRLILTVEVDINHRDLQDRVPSVTAPRFAHAEERSHAVS
jgi:hypothetical protein